MTTTRRPGIAKAGPRRSDSFSALLDQVLTDDSALHALSFAYRQLESSERRRLILAVLEDAKSPARALAAFLAVEEDGRLRERLRTLLRTHAKVQLAAFVWGSSERGGAQLVRSFSGGGSEALCLCWNQSTIKDIEVKSSDDPTLVGRGSAVDPAEAVALVVPMLWRYIRHGNRLPPGSPRFASFFSLPHAAR